MMKKNTLEIELLKLEVALSLLYKNRYVTPLLVLTYSLIDIMASLDRRPEHEDVKRSDFLSWVDIYINPETTLDCSSLDLYAARCGLVHSYNPSSKLSRDNEAFELYYAMFGATKEKFEREVAQVEYDTPYKVIVLETLLRLLINGVDSFLKNKGDDELVLEHARKYFGYLPALSDNSVKVRLRLHNALKGLPI